MCIRDRWRSAESLWEGRHDTPFSRRIWKHGGKIKKTGTRHASLKQNVRKAFPAMLFIFSILKNLISFYKLISHRSFGACCYLYLYFFKASCFCCLLFICICPGHIVPQARRSATGHGPEWKWAWSFSHWSAFRCAALPSSGKQDYQLFSAGIDHDFWLDNDCV